MKRSKKKPKQSIKLRERVEDFLQKNPTAIKKIPPTDIRNLFEELQIYQVELENRNDELLKAQEQLQESEEKYRQLFATISDAIILFDAETKEIIDANDAVSAFYGYTKEELLELKPTDITAERKETDESIGQTIAGKISSIPIRYHMRKDGTTFPVEISSGTFKLGNRQLVFGVARDITERKETERSLIENMDKYRDLVDYSIDGIAVVQGQDIKFVNSALIKMFGYQDKLEMVDHKFTEFIAPEYKDLMVQMGRNREKGKQAPGRYKFKALRNDGKKFDAEISVSRIYYQGKVARQGVIRDITKEKVTEDALRESEEKYRSLVTNIPEITWTTDYEFNTIFISSNIQKELGYTPEEIYKSGDSVFPMRIHPENIETVEKAFKELFKKGTMFDVEYRIKRKNGEWFWAHDRSIATYERDGVMYADGIFSNITDRKRAEEALQKAHDELEQRVEERTVELLKTNEHLKESENRFRQLAEGTFEAIIIHAMGVILQANEQFFEMFGHEPHELIGTDAISLITPPDSAKFIREQISLGNLGPYEVTGVKKDGTQFPMEVRAKMMKYKGKMVRMAAIRDLTNRKIVEKELDNKAKDLEELNAALNVLLKKRQEDKIELQDNILSNIKILIEPYVNKLKQSGLPQVQKTLINILESNLNEIISPFTRKLSSKLLNLSPSEIQVANLVKSGKTNKEIAEISHVAKRTIEFHRENIRKKFGITNQKTNLKTYLMSLD